MLHQLLRLATTGHDKYLLTSTIFNRGLSCLKMIGSDYESQLYQTVMGRQCVMGCQMLRGPGAGLKTLKPSAAVLTIMPGICGCQWASFISCCPQCTNIN